VRDQVISNLLVFRGKSAGRGVHFEWNLLLVSS
jgi:hypothetical protein